MEASALGKHEDCFRVAGSSLYFGPFYTTWTFADVYIRTWKLVQGLILKEALIGQHSKSWPSVLARGGLSILEMSVIENDINGIIGWKLLVFGSIRSKKSPEPMPQDLATERIRQKKNTLDTFEQFCLYFTLYVLSPRQVIYM